MALREDTLQRWVERVEAQRTAAANHWTTDELREIASEMGMSGHEFDEMLGDAAAHRQRGETLFGHGRIEDAREAFQMAADLVPSDVEALHGLARCFYSIGMRDRHNEALQTARGYAHAVLRLAPMHDGAAQLLNAIDSAISAIAPQRSGGSRGFVLAGIVAALVLAGGVVGYITLSPQTFESAAPWSGNATASGPLYEVGDRQMPVDFDMGPAESGLHLDIRESVLSVYDDSAWANVRGYLVNDSTLELFEVTGQARVVSEDGTGMGTRPVRFVESDGPSLRPGESVPFYALLEVNPEAERWAVSLDTVNGGEAPDKYDPAPVITPRFEVEPRSGMGVEIRERHLAYSANQFNERGGWLRGELRFINSGTRDIETLRVRVDGLGMRGEVIESSTRYVVSTSGPRMSPGDAVSLRIAISMPPQNHGIRVAITGLD